MIIDGARWVREWPVAELLRQLADNDIHGLFADSLSVPSLFGGEAWRPRLPDLDPAFEAACGASIDSAGAGGGAGGCAAAGYGRG